MPDAATSPMRDRVALVTGAGSGIGLATAERLARAGAHVILLGRTRDELQKASAGIERDGGRAEFVTADVSVPEQMQAAFATIAANHGRLDVVVANAGINGTWAPVEELSVADWDETLQINLRGTFLTVKYAIPLMRKRGGSIIIVSSVNGTRMFSNAGASAYATSKAGQVAFSRMTALELARHRIRVNCVCPGAITTMIDDNTNKMDTGHLKPAVDFPEGRIPLTGGKPGRATQVADLIHFLASDAAGHISGAEVFIDGAQSLLQG